MVSDQSARLVINRSRWVALTAMMTALALTGNYVLVFAPNAEVGTTVLYLTAYTFGLSMAVWVTLIMSLIYSSFNPWGGMVPIIWFGQFIGWIYTSIVGGVMGRSKDTSRKELLAAAFVCTLVFQMSVNIAYSLNFNIPLPIALLTGFPYLLAQLSSNLLLFPLVIPNVTRAIRKGFAGIIWEPADENHDWSEE